MKSANQSHSVLVQPGECETRKQPSTGGVVSMVCEERPSEDLQACNQLAPSVVEMNATACNPERLVGLPRHAGP
eukprot:5290725-Pleurochrysis_carterae.AAC.4